MLTVTFYGENVATDKRTSAEMQADIHSQYQTETERGRERGLVGVTATNDDTALRLTEPGYQKCSGHLVDHVTDHVTFPRRIAESVFQRSRSTVRRNNSNKTDRTPKSSGDVCRRTFEVPTDSETVLTPSSGQ